MSTFQKMSVFLMRVAMGWLFFYAGIMKVFANPPFSAAGFLKGAKTFPVFYQSLTSPELLPVTNFLNEWGLTLIGASLIIGALVKWSSICGAILMILYYFPVLTFPTIGANAYIVDEHIIYALIFLFFFTINAGKIWGADALRNRS